MASDRLQELLVIRRTREWTAAEDREGFRLAFLAALEKNTSALEALARYDEERDDG